MHVMGNANANAFWYKLPPEERVVDKDTPMVIRQKHIVQKYAKKLFADLLTEQEQQILDQVCGWLNWYTESMFTERLENIVSRTIR